MARTTPASPPPLAGTVMGRVFRWVLLGLLGVLGLAFAAVMSVVLLALIAMAAAYPNLPDISDLQDYRPKLPLRVFSAEGVLIGEFGEERRRLTPIGEIPQVMKDAVLAIEDSRFYSHSGVDYRGLARAALANLWKVKSQGASTITMQVARNAYLSSEKTYTRKLYEVLLTFKLEHSLSKDQILEIYMNQIFLGNRAYGFAAAAETYFGKPLREITLAEAAMLAGLPKAPSAYNPIHNPKRARARQLHILERMLENGFITPSEAREAKREPLQIVAQTGHTELHAEYLAETVRQLMYARYGEETYTRGLHVFTTLRAADQIAAYRALRRGIMVYERRQHYRGPEGFVDLPQDPEIVDDVIDDALLDHPDNDEVLSAVVVDATPRKVQVIRRNGELLDIVGNGLQPVQSGLSPRAADRIRIRRGSIVRIVRHAKGYWELTQLPEVEGAFVAMDPRNGEVRAMVGGFDFAKNKFNHVTQAWRQPGSSFKPFIYSAALEHGITPATVVMDGPLFFDAGTTGSAPWEPKNYDGKFEGPMTLRRALARSKNMVSIRVLQVVGTKEAQQWITRFGFDADKHPPYLTMALGAGSVTPMQMAVAYSVFANGGRLVQPSIIRVVTDHKGKVLSRTEPGMMAEAMQVIDERNAFVMNSLLQEVTRSGTAASAQATLRRPDLYGKTGTTNDSVDAWFAGFHPSLTAVTWIGYDIPRNLGSRETGGGLSLPIWIEFMAHALKNIPVAEPEVPEGVVFSGGEWFYEEYARSTGVATLGVEGAETWQTDGQVVPPAAEEEKKQILDLFQKP